MIEIKVEPGDTAKTSRYKPAGKRAWLTWKKLRTFLMDEMDYEPEEAEKEITIAYGRAMQQTEEDPNVYVPELSGPIKVLFKNFKWYSDSDGAMSFFIKMDKHKEMYTMTKDPMIGSSAVMWNNGKSIEENMREVYLRLGREGKLDFVTKKNELDNSASHTRILPTIHEYWNEYIRPIWVTDTSFRLDKRPVEISTDPKEPTFFFFDEARLKPGKHPTWEEWMERMPTYSREVFKAWIYSIFDPENKGRQCMWLADRGYSGKSSVIRAITQFMGDKCVGAISHGSLSNQFGYSSVYGKRLVVYGDNKNPKLIHQEKVHSILGADTVNIEFKQRDTFACSIHCKLLIGANTPPEIELTARNELTRIIFIYLADPPDHILKKYCKLDAKGNIRRYEDGMPHFIGGKLDALLFKELPAFLESCRKSYRLLCPARMDIPLSKELYRDLHTYCASPEHLSVEQFVEEQLEIGDTLQCRRVDVSTAFTRFRKSKGSSFDMARLLGYLKAVHGVEQEIVAGKRLLFGCSVQGKSETYSPKKKGVGTV